MVLVPVTAKVGVEAPEITTLFTEVGTIAPNVKVIAGVVVALATEPDTPLAVVTETEVTVPVVEDKAVQVFVAEQTFKAPVSER